MLHSENEESCTTYNMLKVSRNLFRWTKQVSYADYYERALTNGVLSIQKENEPGAMIYMLPLGHGVSKGRSTHGWGTQFNSFWCCYGTGIESFSKLGDSIYFEEEAQMPQLYVIQYIPSSVDWASTQISLIQIVDDVVSWDQSLKVKIQVSAKEGSGMATLNFRIPSWTSSSGLKAFLNGDLLPLSNPGTFLSVSRIWGNADEVELQFPLVLRTEFVQDDRPIFASLQAILYGPFLLVGLCMGDYDIQVGSVDSTSDWVTPISSDYNSHLVSLAQESGNTRFFLFNQNQVIKMHASLQDRNDSYVHATFRLILEKEILGQEGIIGQSVMLEPFDLPGMVVAYNYQEAPKDGIMVVDYSAFDHKAGSAEFLIVKGLNGKNGTISLQTKAGCFIYAGVKYSKSDTNVIMSCKNESSWDSMFKEAVSFTWNQGLKSYHPVSFIAKGLRRSYVLEPLFGLKDESYNVYFNITK
ncbi:uncharacterized protein LOC104908285 [Beta vulgaris subsp. vulgaris]|uniref:uncharacterized protein LOC104908285 n=1 Tax=Beta vulgaris subsp. vulgaris TaxID=3555 RepID=UPI0025467412|nr:uncharacterized protein LOC104908285 [Beta vulgaris subsp. vulgaris]